MMEMSEGFNVRINLSEVCEASLRCFELDKG